MTSKLAKQQIEQWWQEGLKPTVEDIILLNNLGLEVERGSDMFSFSACPRMAFLGDNILREPTVAKRLWIDQVQGMFADTFETRIYIMAYALGTPDDELPSIANKSEIEKGIMAYRDNVLLNFTDTQIVAALDYVLNGNKPDLEIPQDASEEKKSEIEKLREIYDVPNENHSLAKQLILQAMVEKIPEEATHYALLEDLERMLLVAAMQNGKDILKNEHTKASGHFYMASGRIHERLVGEKKKNDEEEGKTK